MSITRRTFTTGAMVAGAALAQAGAVAATPPRTRRISVEECFSTKEIDAARAKLGGYSIQAPQANRERLHVRLEDIGAGRIAQMDADGVAVQILSLCAPGVQDFPADRARGLATDANDQMVEAIRRHPTRYAGLATLVPQDVAFSVAEIVRAKALGLNGTIINSHTNGEYLDDPKFWPIFEALEAHDLPLYIHPREPSPQMAGPLKVPGFAVGWGYAVETGTHVIRMLGSGMFDRFREVQIVIGHMGEGVVFYLPRIDNRYTFEMDLSGRPRLARMPGEYFRDHFHVTTSGMNYWPQLRMSIDVIGIDRLMFAADYPMEVEGDAVAAIDAAPMTASAKAKLYHGNAERVFRIQTG